MEILKSEQYISEKLNIKPIKDVANVFKKEPNVDENTRKFIEKKKTNLYGIP